MTRNGNSFGPGGGDTGGGTGTDGDGAGNYVAATRNQGFIAIAAERLGVGNPVYGAPISATAAEARAGFDLISGEAHTQAVSVSPPADSKRQSASVPQSADCVEKVRRNTLAEFGLPERRKFISILVASSALEGSFSK